MLPQDYLASISLASPAYDGLIREADVHPEKQLLMALTGFAPVTEAEEETMLGWIRDKSINPNMRFNARIMHMDQRATPPIGTLWTSYEGCKLSHLLLAFAKRSPRVMQAFIASYVNPNALEFIPFWSRRDNILLPGHYAEHGAGKNHTLRDVIEIASDVSWPLLIRDPRINLTPENSLNHTIADRYIYPIIVHLGFMGDAHIDQLGHYPRAMQLLEANAPLHYYHDNHIVRDWMHRVSQPDWDRFCGMQPSDDSSWITPLVVRQWSLGGRLPEVIAADYWHGKEPELLRHLMQLPDNEKAPLTSEILALHTSIARASSFSWQEQILRRPPSEIRR